MLYDFFWVIPRRLNSDAGELPRRRHTKKVVKCAPDATNYCAL